MLWFYFFVVFAFNVFMLRDVFPKWPATVMFYSLSSATLIALMGTWVETAARAFINGV